MNLLKTRGIASLIAHKKAVGDKVLVPALEAALEHAHSSWCIDIRTLSRQAKELVA
jgi:hypothetical protein